MLAIKLPSSVKRSCEKSDGIDDIALAAIVLTDKHGEFSLEIDGFIGEGPKID
jgi:hypothetical protein